MFFAYNRDLPEVERYIFDMLGPRDLVWAKQVCRGWAVAVRRYIGHLNPQRTSDLMKEAFQEPVPIFAVITLPQPVIDLTINDNREVYILGQGTIMKLDNMNLSVSETMDIGEPMGNATVNSATGNDKKIYASKSGNIFQVKDFQFNTIDKYKRYRSSKCLAYDGKKKAPMSKNVEVTGTRILSEKRYYF